VSEDQQREIGFKKEVDKLHEMSFVKEGELEKYGEAMVQNKV